MRTLKSKRSALRTSQNGHSAIEFSVAIYVFFLLTLFPLINLLGLAVAAATTALVTTQLASTAATQQSYNQALQGVVQESSGLLKTGFANFIKLRSAGGYRGSGANLYVLASNFSNGSSVTYGPNTPVPSVDTTKNIYEYNAQTTFFAGPLIPMSGVPFISSVPGLGRPAQISWSASRAAEYATGIQSTSGSKISGAVPSIALGPSGVPPVTISSIPNSSAPWRDPHIFSAIQQAGQTIVSQNVLTVPMNAAGWTDSGVAASGGQTVWMDSRSDGLWIPGGITGMFGGTGTMGFDAAGNYLGGAIGYSWVSSPPPGAGRALAYNIYASSQMNEALMLAYVGSPPPSPTVQNPATAFPWLVLGNSLTNYPIPTSGEIWIVPNNLARGYGQGQQYVRIIITK